MSTGIPFGYYQGNRSQALAVPGLSKLGFTIPVPREEDHFGIDFIVHLSRLEKNVIRPLGKCFGIQIKSDEKPLNFDNEHERECLYNSSIPFFLGVVSRSSLTLKIYNTQSRIAFFWKEGLSRPFEIIPKNTGQGLKAPDYSNGKVWTGKPILKISLKDPASAKQRLEEISKLQAVIASWIDLENQMLSLKEQDVPIVLIPQAYKTNEPLEIDNPGKNKFVRIAYSNPTTLQNICQATEKILDSLSVYLTDCLKLYSDKFESNFNELLQNQLNDVEKVRKQNFEIIGRVRVRSARKS